MRKCNLIIIIVLAVSFILTSGVSADELRWELGLKGGATWGQLIGDPLSFWATGSDGQLSGTIADNKLGFNGGLFLTLFFNDWIGIQGEAMYMQKGGQGLATGQIMYYPEGDNPRPAFFDGTAYLNLENIEFPVLAIFEFKASEGGKVRLRGLAGPVFSYNIHAETRLEGTAEITLQDTSTRSQSIDQTEEVGQYVKSFEFGLMFGGAVYWDIGNVDLLIEGRWQRGLNTIDNTTQGREIRTSNVSLLFGFSYPFGD
jgi:hypothetical protein